MEIQEVLANLASQRVNATTATCCLNQLNVSRDDKQWELNCQFENTYILRVNISSHALKCHCCLMLVLGRHSVFSFHECSLFFIDNTNIDVQSRECVNF